MFKEFLQQTLPSILSIILTTLFGILSYHLKKFLSSKQVLLEREKQQLLSKIGHDNYDHDLKLAQGIIYSIEQLGKEYNWEGAIKHARATELISQKTHLLPEDIFNIIKATIGAINLKLN